ncbi:MAG: methylthioribulose 1-phosphate dehydratase [Alphaproteobacteria bacterium]|nr:methylthioribulose 1-phosphate dehydratase [Alphaproteobacteria bacterium]
MALAHHSGAKNWVPATSGNFSVRIDARDCAVTASGGDKGKVTADGIIRAGIHGPAHPRASAEAPLHYAIYRLSPAIGAVAHVHALPAVLASLALAHEARVRIEGLELLKAFRGVKTHETHLDVPVFANDQDMDALAERVEARLKGMTPAWGFLLAGHGLYVWGQDATETLRHLDAFDYLFTLMLKLKGIPA